VASSATRQTNEKKPKWLSVAFWSFLVALLGVGFGGAWWAPMTWDETHCYYPAVKACAAELPRVPTDQGLPGPPTGLVIQGIVFRLFHGAPAALRMLSTLATAAMAAILFLHFRRYGESPREAAQLLMICLFPFVFYNAFTFKQHALALAFLVGGLALWGQARGAWSGRSLLVASLLFTFAVTTNQLTAPVFVALAIEAYRDGVARFRWPFLVASLVPLVVLGVLFLAWQGPVPPAYRTNQVRLGVGFGGLYPLQLLVLAQTIGVWLAPSMGLPRKSLVRSTLLALPFAFVVLFSGFLDPPAAVLDSIAGPITTSLRLIARYSYPAAAIVAGWVCGLGTDLVLRAGDLGTPFASFGVFAVAYGCMMLFAPYLFESYYLVFFVASSLILRGEMSRAWPSPVAVSHKVAVAGAGIVYTLGRVAGVL
jgi:hypothetical protein